MDEPTKTARGRNRTLVRFAVVVLSLGGTLAALEAGARLAMGDEFIPGIPGGTPDEATAQVDPDVGWVSKPGVSTRIVAPRFQYRVRINSKGLRDREHPYEKPEGVFRIALLGDSIAWGWGVDDGLCFADLVEERLGPGVEVINLGVPGYGTDQQLWMLEREGWRYEPDLVLLCFLMNDIPSNDSTKPHGEMSKPRYVLDDGGKWRIENRPVADLPQLGGPSGTFLQRLSAQSACLQWLRPQAAQVLSDDSPEPGAERRQLSPRMIAKLRTYEAQARSIIAGMLDRQSSTRMLFGELSRACREREVPFVAFAVSHHHDEYLYSPNFAPPKEYVSGDADPAEHRTYLSDCLAELGREQGFATFRVDGAMLARTLRGETLHCGDGHLNELGNEVVAERVIEELRSYLP